ncbi:MAG TPA: hypothetical protein VMQ76_11825 [Terracidiphilus sp.]|jgi:hypothetical protein|nr:hypothetical protein [Terracidiphilus sp.]
MPFSVRFSVSLAVTAVLALSFATRVQAQSTAAPTAGNGTYIASDPLAGVRYDNRYDVSLGMAYRHIKAGPNVLQGANLGGLDLSASYWFSKHWAVEGSGRYYLGTSGVGSVGGSNTGENLVKGPFVSEQLFVAGPEWLGPHNKHGALSAHALFGGAHFDSHDFPQTPQTIGFYNNQVAPAAIIGGHMDLNRSAHWVFRITPDAVITRYSANSTTNVTQTDVNFAISVGIQYKFSKKR